MSSLSTPEKAIPITSYSRRDWQQGYLSQPQEFDYPITEITGTIPPELQGTLFRNGPGLLDINGETIHHPFDGDGMITALSIKDGQAHLKSRYVQTKGYVAEKAAGKILYRGVFGTQKAGGWLANIFDFQLKNIANTNIIYWGDKLLALWEAAQPHRLDPQTLETLGLDDLDGVLAPGAAFAAHPRIVDDRLINFAVSPGLSSKITIYEFDRGGKLLQKQNHSVPGFSFIHDFVVTENYYLFFQNPVTFNPLPFALGIRGAGECVGFDASKPTKILVIPRKENQRENSSATPALFSLETRAGFVFHHANAWEAGGKVYVDSICYESFPDVEPGSDFRDIDFASLDPGQLWRFSLDLDSGVVDRTLLEPCCCEFPTTNPQNMGKPYRYLYLGAGMQPTGNAPLQQILKLDLTPDSATNTRQFWNAGDRCFVSEPIFVPHPQATAEDQGWVLSVVYDASRHRSDLVILDAQNLSNPVAKLHLQHHIPYGLHGSWTDRNF
jgi:all-trans-8'-apo-beta-carotenal 15,15'-oxygenase